LLEREDGEEFTFWHDEGEQAVLDYLETLGLPFEPEEIHGVYVNADGRVYVTYSYRCPLVTPEGLCGDYEHRPSTCRDYVPGSSRLCVFGGGRI
jgi:Fe-S-cluster containining protein